MPRIRGWWLTPLILTINWAFVACADDHQMPTQPVPTPIDTLHTAATFTVGVAIDPYLMRTRRPYYDVVMKHYNGITAENAMKMGWLCPSKGSYNFSDADYLISVAQEQRKRVHGHVLIWHSFNDINWVKQLKQDSATWEQFMKAHIQTVASHFKGKTASWDVVNEAFMDDGTLRKFDPSDDGKEDGSPWARNLGDDFIARAFQYAHQADPNALLFYNDYGQETNSMKLAAIVSMVEDFKKRGIPIHGVGLQMHISISTPNEGIVNAIRDLANTGVMVHISELDVNISGFVKNPALQFTDEDKQQQKDKYEFVAKTYKQFVPENQRFGITLWNVGDADSWLRSFIQPNEWPLPFDDDYQPKPAFYGLRDGLKK